MSLKKVYLYLISAIALTIAMVGAISALNIGLKVLIMTRAHFTLYDIQHDLPWALSMLIVSLPVWYFHWRLAKREV